MDQRSGQVSSDSEYDRDALIIRDVDTTTDVGSDDPAEIRADIEQTRDHMSETINAITERLSPDNIKEQVVEQVQELRDHVKEQVVEQVYEFRDNVREATIGRAEDMVRQAGDTVSDARYTIMETIKQNPIPAALTGLGLGWLWMNRRSAPSRPQSQYSQRNYGDYRRGAVQYDTGGGGYYAGSMPQYQGQRGYEDYRSYGNTGGSVTGQVRDAAGNLVGQAQQTASSVAGQAQNTVSNLASSAQQTAGNLASSAQQTAGNLASSAQDTVGNLASTAQQTAGQVVDTVQDRAGQIVDTAQYQAQRLEDTVQRQLSQNPLAVGAVALALGAAVGLAIPQTEKEDQLMGEARDNLVEKAQEVASQTMEKVQQVAGEVTEGAKETVQQQAQQAGLTSGQ